MKLREVADWLARGFIRAKSEMSRSCVSGRRGRRPLFEPLESRYALAADGDFGLAFSPGRATGDDDYSIAVDSSANIFVAGNFANTVDFDPGPGVYHLTATGSVDAFVAKYSPAGSLIWARAFGGTLFDKAAGVAVDGWGNTFVAGSFAGTAAFDPTGSQLLTSKGSSDIFVAKLDSAGALVWVKGIGGVQPDHGNAIAVDDEGSIYSTGGFYSAVDFDPGPDVHNLVGRTDAATVFVSKLDSEGNYVYATSLQTGSANSIGVDALHNAYIDRFGVVSKLDTSGALLMKKSVGPTAAMAIASNGDIYTTGSFQNTVDFDPGPGMYKLTSVALTDIFISKLDTNGNFVYARQIGGPGNQQAKAIAIDASDNVYTTGYFVNTTDFDPGPGTQNLSPANGSLFVSKLNANGGYVFARQWKSGSKAIAVDVDSNIYTVGGFSGTVDFDPGLGTYYLTAPDSTSAYVSKLRGLPGVITYVENSPGVSIAGSSTLTGSTNYANGHLKVQVTAGGSSNDVLAIANQGSGAGQIGVSGNRVKYEGATIGTFSGGTNSGPLAINFNSTDATTPAVQALMRAITFANTSEMPYTALRNVKFILIDGFGGTVYPVEPVISVVSVNDPPAMTAPSYAKTPINQEFIFPSNAFSVSDIDAGTFNGQLTLTASHGKLTLATTAGLTFMYGSNGDAGFTVKGQLPAINNALVNLKFAPSDSFYGLGGVSLLYNDFGSGSISGGNWSASGNVKISIYDPSELVVFPYDPEFMISGKWKNSGLPGYNNTLSLYGVGFAQWTPRVPQAGNYKVEFYRVMPGLNGTPRVKIESAGGTNTYSISQSGSSGFLDLGTHFFSGQGDEKVTLTAQNGGDIRASAVRFTRIT